MTTIFRHLRDVPKEVQSQHIEEHAAFGAQLIDVVKILKAREKLQHCLSVFVPEQYELT